MTPDIIAATIVSLVSLLVTILGWVFTYSKQKQLLEMQIEAEDERAARQFFIPQRVDELKELKDWFKKGIELASTPKDAQAALSTKEIEQQRRDWNSQYWRLSIFASRVDTTAPTPLPPRDTSGIPLPVFDVSKRIVMKPYNLERLVSEFYDAIWNFLQQDGKVPIFDAQTTWSLDFARERILPTAIRKIDELIEQTAICNKKKAK